MLFLESSIDKNTNDVTNNVKNNVLQIYLDSENTLPGVLTIDI
jgi:hypothetical protein